MLRTRQLRPFGIELVDVDLTAELDAPTFQSLRQLVVEEGLVLARGQHLSSEAQCRLGLRFGPIESLSLDRSDGDRKPGVLIVSNVGEDGRVLEAGHPRMKTLAINERWHTDSSFRDAPASISLLAGVVIPDEGGDTLFASLRRGWESLPEGRRNAVTGLCAVHDYSAMGLPLIAHPLVRTHPETGRENLYLSEHAPTIDGWPAAKGRALVAKLITHCTRDAEVYRHSWTPGDLLFWDNRSVLHRTDGFTTEARTLHHVRIAGDVV